MKRFVLALLVVLVVGGMAEARTPARKGKSLSPGAAQDFVDLESRPAKAIKRAKSASGIAQASGNILVISADPELLIVSNSFDLKGRQVHFQPTIQGRYTYGLATESFDGTADQTLTLRDDDSVELVFNNFVFPFGKKSYDRCFVNSNGNITFQQPDVDPPNAETLLTGPPRIAAFFTDLDPETTGTIFLNQTTDRVVISWLKVPEFFNQNQFDYGQNTFQIVLHRDGGITLVFSADMTATQAFTGILAGNKDTVRTVDFSNGISSTRPRRSFLENFHDYESIDIPRLMKSVYQSQKDSYDFVTLLSNFDLTPIPGVQAFALNVRNTTDGIGDPSGRGKAIFKNNSQYGSKKRLQNITFLGNIHQYPANWQSPLPDTDTSLLEILAHEVAHRWLSYIKFPVDGKNTKILLGRDQSHWSFFFDSRGSFLEGNQIISRNANSFETSTPFQRYSPLDLYLMGLLSPDSVPDIFYVTGASDFSPDFQFSDSSEPEANVHFNGTAVPVRISDVLAANGNRKPSTSTSQKEFNHLFILITKSDRPAAPEELQYSELLRQSWEEFFASVTGGRGKIVTKIQ